jgi:carboxylesterase type B
MEVWMTRKRIVMLAGAVAIVALLAVGGVATVFAASPPATPDATSQPNRAQEFLNRLANNLGISTDKLQQGLKTTADQTIDNAVANGKITQAQADKAKAKVDSGNGLNAFTHALGRRQRNIDWLRFGSWQDIATALNTTPQDLKTQIQSGKTLKEIITNQNKSVDDVVNAVVAQVKVQLDPAVSNGKITQTREDTVLSNLKTRLTNLINNGGPTFGNSATPNATPSGVSG